MRDISPQNKTKNHQRWRKIFLIIAGALISLYLLTIPWRNYIYRSQMEKGDDALAGRQYTLAYLYYQKAGVLKFGDRSASDRQNLAKNAAVDILSMRDFLAENNYTDLLQLIDNANSKVCNLEVDRTLIEKGLPQVAKINLTFCANEGPKNYDSWLFLGLANQKISEDNYIFKELKPDYRKEAIAAFEAAYKADPISKTPPEFLIALYKTENNQEKVDYWTNLLDNLNKIEK